LEIKEYKSNIGGVLGLLLLYLFLSILILGPLKYLVPNPSNIFLESVTLIAKDIFGNVLVFYFILRSIRSSYERGFKLSFVGAFHYKFLISVLLIAAGFFLWYHNSIGIWADHIPMGKLMEDAWHQLELDYKRNPYPVISMVVITAPFFEEILFRGIILRGLLAQYKPSTAILLSSLFFGLIHMNGPQFCHAFLIGLFLGIIYYKTHSLWLCMSVHALNNGMGCLVDSDKFEPVISAFFIGIAVFLVGLFLLKKSGLFDLNRSKQEYHPEISALRESKVYLVLQKTPD